MREIYINPHTQRELIEAYGYYQKQEAGLGERLFYEVDMALSQIAQRPLSFRVVASGCRRCLLKRFPYGLIFKEIGDRLEIIAFMHHARRPGYWTSRL